MPIYEYECRKCKAHVEVMQKISDKPLSKCPKCGGRLEKQWSSTSFQLKGSGWYATDYAAKKSETKETKTESKEETPKGEAKEDKGPKKDSATTGDKATPKESSTSKKSGSSKTAPSSGD
jgi:putative FmdB family regulatory protein